MYDRPANLFVATFIGSPGMNLVKGRIIVEEGAVICRLGDQDIVVPGRSSQSVPPSPATTARMSRSAYAPSTSASQRPMTSKSSTVES